MSEDITGHRPLIIAGSGISGLSAAIYAARANNEPLVFEGDEPGGQLTLTTEVENYPGIDESVSGSELIQQMKNQAEKFGTEIQHGIIETIDDSERPFTVTLENGDIYTCDALIAASGASAKTLGVPGENELFGYGVSSCATCDGAFFRGEEMLVVGGGDAAAEEATFLTKFASKVYVAQRRDELRAEGYLRDRLLEKEEEGEIEILWNTEVEEITGTKEDGVHKVNLVKHQDGYPKKKLEEGESVERDELEVGAVFLAIGHTPNTEYLEDTEVLLDDDNYIIVENGRGGGKTKTGVEGLFAAGDVVDHHYQQAATASGMGVMAAMDANDYLEDFDDE